MPRIITLVGAAILFIAAGAPVQGAHFLPNDNAAALKECGACHLAFPPQMLPAQSWQKIMADLPHHFGEDASLPAAVRAEINAYLAGHAADADATRGGGRYFRGIPIDATPLRITQTAPWLRRHRGIAPGRFVDAEVKSPANCQACHKGAGRGTFGEDDGE